jgi:hypothetical protein
MYRRRLIRPGYAALCKVLSECRVDLHEQHFQHLCELADLRKELDTVRAQYEALRGAVLEREKAEANLALLQRDRDRRTCIVEGACYWLH